MYTGIWIFLFGTTLCLRQRARTRTLFFNNEEASDKCSTFVLSQNFNNRRTRSKIKETSCIDIDGKQVKNGDPFVPEGQTSCQHCKCVDGEPDECFIAKCAKPTCDDYKEVAGECCAYTCPSSKSDAAELAVIISLSVGLLLLLVLLIVVIDRNRRKNQRNRTRDQALDHSRQISTGPLNNRLDAITEGSEDQIEPPPPYTPGRGRYSLRKPHYPSPPLTPNEPPPPYEINSREATQV